MDPPAGVWRCVSLLLLVSIPRCPLGLVGGQRFNYHGDVTVEPASCFLLGSNLTVYCHIRECKPSSRISLDLNGVAVKPRRRVNCTTVMFDLIGVQEPESMVICKWQDDNLSLVVGGLDLQGGRPPVKPAGVFCNTTRSSDVVSCWWNRGPDTFVPTSYSVSVSRDNGTRVYSNQTRDAGGVSIPRGLLDVNTFYQLTVSASNLFGASQCDPFRLRVQDVVMPEAPLITAVDSVKGSSAAVLWWSSSESSVSLRPHVRLRPDDGLWEVREGAERSEGVVRVEDLRPLTDYQFQMRTCESRRTSTTPGLTSSPTSTSRSSCSRWSTSVRWRSPGRGPSKQLHAWRMLGKPKENGRRGVTVLWKPLSPDDFSGEVQHYEILLPDSNVSCAATLTQCLIQVPEEIQTLGVSAVTSYGTSPPAVVPVRRSGGFAPVLDDVAPAGDGGALLVSWSWPGAERRSTSGEELLRYVVEWTGAPAAALQWLEVEKDRNSTSITGLTAGVRYNVSLFAVTTGGASAPSSRLVYSKELKPLAGPIIEVLVHKPRRIQLWLNELPVDLQRGFITNYSIYIQQLEGRAELRATLPASGPGSVWLDCPGGALAVQLTASNSAGEGPRSGPVASRPAGITHTHSLVIVLVFIVALFIATVANLMCWSCVRRRIKQKCVSWGPAWLVENLPKPGNSRAIRLLEMEGSEPSFSYAHTDPPLSPISLLSWEERDDVYPNVHVELSRLDSGQPTARTSLLTPGGRQLEHVNYRPQVATLASRDEEANEAEEEQGEASASEDEDGRSAAFEGLLGGLLSSVEVDNSPLGLTLGPVGGFSRPKTSPAVDRAPLSLRGRAEGGVEVGRPVQRLPQPQIKKPDAWEVGAAPFTAGTASPRGYFPQTAAICGEGSNSTRT